MAAQTELFCDLVMKGGITSGIVYPQAISALSREYMLKNIGGTSAGAIAAAAAAAAEYRRRQTGRLDGFDQLDKLPGQLGQSEKSERSRLLRLFQPQEGTKPLFAMLLGGLDRPSAGSRIRNVVAAGLRSFWPYVLAGLTLVGGSAGLTLLDTPCTGAACWIRWTPEAVLGAVGALAGLAYGVYRCLARDVVENGFGLCKGFGAWREPLLRRAARWTIGTISFGYFKGPAERIPTADEEELTPWLHRLINTLAGRNANDAPLTFGELWDAKGFPPTWLADRTGKSKSIDLRMVTTNLTHGRPYTLPFADKDARLFFKRAELERYFPEKVVDWLVEHATPYERDEKDPPSKPDDLLQLPGASELPVVFAARLSLSFPVLISAVPLWAVDYEHPQPQRSFQKCWFSDGGISSNFPVHLFDSLLPLWPTFGLKLEGFLKGYADRNKDRIYMPTRNIEGWGDGWNRFDEESGFARLAGFLNAIVDAMMNWNDNTLARLPGYRDRIARIRLDPDEGGMNLNMDDKRIKALSGYGGRAGAELVERFVRNTPVGSKNPIAMGLENHRWIRLRSLIGLLEETVPQLKDILQRTPPPAGQSYAAQVQGAASRNKDQYPLTDPQQLATVAQVLADIASFAGTLTRSPSTGGSAPKPLPSLRVRPKV